MALDFVDPEIDDGPLVVGRDSAAQLTLRERTHQSSENIAISDEKIWRKRIKKKSRFPTLTKLDKFIVSSRYDVRFYRILTNHSYLSISSRIIFNFVA